MVEYVDVKKRQNRNGPFKSERLEKRMVEDSAAIEMEEEASALEEKLLLVREGIKKKKLQIKHRHLSLGRQRS